MLSSITPFGERGRGNRYAVTVTLFLLAGAAGGAVTGALLGGVGWLLIGPAGFPAGFPADPRLVAVGAVAALAALAEAAGRSPRGWRRQVNEAWLVRYRRWVYATGYGAQLGCGWATRVTTPLLPAAAAAAVLTGSPAAGLAVGALFGCSRGLPLIAGRRAATAGQLRRLHARLVAAAGSSRLAAVLTAAAVAVTAWVLAAHGLRGGALR